jgi:hypothetical protein
VCQNAVSRFYVGPVSVALEMLQYPSLKATNIKAWGEVSEASGTPGSGNQRRRSLKATNKLFVAFSDDCRSRRFPGVPPSAPPQALMFVAFSDMNDWTKASGIEKGECHPLGWHSVCEF